MEIYRKSIKINYRSRWNVLTKVFIKKAFTNLIISVTRGVAYTLTGFHLYIDWIFYLNRLQDNVLQEYTKTCPPFASHKSPLVFAPNLDTYCACPENSWG